MTEQKSVVAVETSLDELRERSRQHWEHCTECDRITTQSDINCSEEDFRRARREPVPVGKFSMPGWSGHNWFYLTRCGYDDCPRHQEASEGFYVDYPHGYTNGGHLYLRCPSCERIQQLNHPGVYWNEGMHAPPTFWQGIADMVRMMRGKRPIHHGLPPPADWKPPRQLPPAP